MNAVIREDAVPWYRQFWPWFLMALPATAVIAGLVTLFIAETHKDGLVVDDYYKAGLAINADLSRDQEAQKLGLGADVDVNLQQGLIRISLKGHSVPTLTGLRVQLLHPTLARHDLQLLLLPENGGDYVAKLSRAIPPGNWYVMIEPPNLTWRLHGRIRLPSTERVAITSGG